MTRHVAVVTLVSGALALGMGGCSASSPDYAEPAVKLLTYTNVVDQTGSSAYTVASTAHGTVDGFGARLTIDIVIANANGTYFSPTATITLADGSTSVCQVDDLRRRPSLVKTTKDVELPCPDGLPDSGGSEKIVITDEYAG
jgi:hypothetical protein